MLRQNTLLLLVVLLSAICHDKHRALAFFGPQVSHTRFGAPSLQQKIQQQPVRSDMTMRVAKYDMRRIQKFNKIWKAVEKNPSKEAVQTRLLASTTSTIIERCNRKLRTRLITKVKTKAEEFEVEVEPGFGVPLTHEEQVEVNTVEGAERKAARVAIAAAKEAALQEVRDAKIMREEDKEARAKAMEERQAKMAAAPTEEVPTPITTPVGSVVEEEAPALVAEVEIPPAEPAAEPEAPVEEKKEEAPKTISAKLVKELRDATGAGMMDCKKALKECDCDMEAATELLRKKGLAKADKKAGRVAAEGKIGVASDDEHKSAMVEINCETDFVARDSSFLEFVDKVSAAALKMESDSLEGLLAAEIGDEGNVEAARQAMVAKIGENIQVRRMESRGSPDTVVGSYVHMNRIGVLVELEGGTPALAADVAMHVAAMNPPFATPDDVPSDVLEKEKSFLTEQALESGKPKEIVEKMVSGRIRKYLEEICCVSQTFVKTNDETVEKYLEKNGAKMVGFTRIVVGEGIEKKEDNFADEVAKLAGS